MSEETARLAEAVERLIAVVLSQRGQLPGLEPSPLTTTQGVGLAAVVDAGSLRLGALAGRIGTTDATASRMVDVLEEAGLVTRVRDPEDGRGVLIAPTALGRRTVRARRRELVQMVESLLHGLPPADQARFADLLTGLNELLVGPPLALGGAAPWPRG